MFSYPSQLPSTVCLTGVLCTVTDYTDESNSTNKQDSGSTNGADSGYNSLTTEDLLARTISPVRSPSPVYENLESLEVSHPRRPEPKPRKMSREPLKY